MKWEKKEEALDLCNLGLMSYLKGKKAKALDYLNQALAIYKQAGAKRVIKQIEKYIQMLKGK